MTRDYPGPEIETGEEPVPSLLGHPGQQQKAPGQSVLAPGFQPHPVARYLFPRCCQPGPPTASCSPGFCWSSPRDTSLKPSCPGSLSPAQHGGSRS